MNLQLHINDFDYLLPAEKIAQHPAAERDFAKLLIYKRKEGLTQDRFINIANYLTENALVVFNNTRVIHARILFTSKAGSTVEIFCLKPLDPATYENALRKAGECIWECLVGNLRKWKGQELKQYLSNGKASLELRAEILSGTPYGYRIRFSWSDPSIPFGEVLEIAGIIPLPPYIKRPAVETDNHRYQTVYARNEGSVAAPTAGLHFTETILKQLQDKEILSTNLTLHVGAGTFLPVKAEKITDHPMHAEDFAVSRPALEIVLNHKGPLVAVGTTTVRTLESLYWLGIKLIKTGSFSPELDQWECYQSDAKCSKKESLEALYNHLVQNHWHEITASTRIMIVPG
jgi:S-adenosylmethionine:tRNA ribosyltransferase-isomerase